MIECPLCGSTEGYTHQKPWTRPRLSRHIALAHPGEHSIRFTVCYERDDSTGCWDWKLTLSSNGYGGFGVQGERHSAHRWAYENFVGEIPEGLDIDHLCRNRACVNPQHMQPVTRGENLRRGNGNPGKNYCRFGHRQEGENVGTDNEGYPVCLACRDLSSRIKSLGIRHYPKVTRQDDG